VRNSDSIQVDFEAFAGETPARSLSLVDVSRLPELRRKDSTAYWKYIKEASAPKLADLEAMMPRATLPQIVDGRISYKTVNWLSSDQKIVELTSISNSATCAAQFLSLCEHLEREDPDFIKEYADSLFSSAAMGYAMAFHLMGERDDMKELFFDQVIHMDDLVIQVIHRKEQFMDNTHYPMGSMFSRMTEDMASFYILNKAPFLGGPATAPDEQIRPFLEIARDYCSGGKIIEAINTKFPLPKSLISIHNEGLNNATEFLSDDMDMADWMIRQRDHYHDLSSDDKLKFGTYYLWFLAKSYGIEPAPDLKLDPEISSNAAQNIWNGDSRDDCFAHPMGHITVREWPDTCEDFLELLSHEFTHGLEDVALFSLQPDFVKWRQENPGLIEIGDEAMQKNLRSAALALSFNTVSYQAAFVGLNGVGSREGTYYPAEDAKAEEDAKERKKLEDLYNEQMRERHAFGYQGIIASKFMNTLEMIKASRDPLRIFMMGQNAMFKAEAYLKDKFIPAIPQEHKAHYAVHLDNIENHFKAADRREATYHQRLRHMGLAFNDLSTAISEGAGDGFIDLQAPETKEIIKQSLNIVQHAVQGIKLMGWKKDKEEADVAASPAPVVT
jgi:hypothetical protein